MLSEKDKIDILQIIDKKLETEMHFHNAGFHNIETPPTIEKSCYQCNTFHNCTMNKGVNKPCFCPTQTDEELLDTILHCFGVPMTFRQVDQKGNILTESEVRSKMIKQILKHFVRREGK